MKGWSCIGGKRAYSNNLGYVRMKMPQAIDIDNEMKLLLVESKIALFHRSI